jgi:hypothetical protein
LFLLPHYVLLLVIDRIESEDGLHGGLGLFLCEYPCLLLCNPDGLLLFGLSPRLFLLIDPLLLLCESLLLQSSQCSLVLAPLCILFLQVDLLECVNAVLLTVLLALRIVEVISDFAEFLHVRHQLTQLLLPLSLFKVDQVSEDNVWSC